MTGIADADFGDVFAVGTDTLKQTARKPAISVERF